MYSIVLAAALTTGAATPAWGWGVATVAAATVAGGAVAAGAGVMAAMDAVEDGTATGADTMAGASVPQRMRIRPPLPLSLRYYQPMRQCKCNRLQQLRKPPQLPA